MYTAKLRTKSAKSSLGESLEISNIGRKRKRTQDSNSEVNDVFEGSTDVAPKTDISTSRKKRMASLNAIAKVTAVLSDYHFERKESNSIPTYNKKESSFQANQKDKDTTVQSSSKKHVTNNGSVTKEAITKQEEKKVKSAFAVVPKSKPKQIICGIHKATQTVSNDDKYVQTGDTISYENRRTVCTCPSKNPIGISVFIPLNNEQSDCPIHIKSNVLANNDQETLSIPIIKKHYAPSTSNEYKVTMTDNISQLQTNCFQKFLLQHSCEAAKLMFLNSLQEKLKKEQYDDIKEEKPDIPTIKHKSNSFTVPNVTFPSISVPSADKLTIDEKNKLYPINEKGRRSSRQKPRKSCNGWVFEGTPVHESIKQNNQTYVRKYFPTIRRDNEVIHLQDAVVLKSDDETDATDYVARILEFWEDSAGDNSGEMMMSVLWYYKPEQMRVRYSDVEFAEMELFASRHKDDNSVACILDKCFVVSYSQYCRFHSQRKLFAEKRTNQNSLVPQFDNVRSRWLPSPTTNLSLVYFCQYGYDFRSGKIIKHY